MWLNFHGDKADELSWIHKHMQNPVSPRISRAYGWNTTKATQVITIKI